MMFGTVRQWLISAEVRKKLKSSKGKKNEKSKGI